ncbi:hypothetical protein [Mesorhizobium japonicum]|uniref:Mll4041 protein n=1 Tax=Mesorhizobium japonicum (strain LMG 29417 / CECT 9101 / MAFF 303099) TaxID=266835 RepID=Q98EX3_RHILO|nr:hypothetical protein [Mesorhizobium japonicum]BAB50794.1 mll4041 [Mesorhizobium japonicum MAFF 303099]
MPDSITVLKEHTGRRLAKKHVYHAGAWATEAFADPKWFTFEQAPVGDIDDLARVLMETAADPSKTVIRGEPNGSAFESVAQRGRTRRLNAHFDDKPRHWVCVDIDKFPGPEEMDIRREPEEMLSWLLRTQFPEEFQNVRAVWQLSSSAGVKGGVNIINMHVWFWLDRPLGEAELKAWRSMRGFPADPRLFLRVQIHYTANPVFQGASDPCGARWGWLEGARDFVSVPSIGLANEAPRGEGTGWGDIVSGDSVEEILAQMGEGEEHLKGFHAVILSAGMHWAKATPPSRWEAEMPALKEMIRKAARSAPRTRSLQDIEERYLTDGELDRIIRGATQRVVKLYADMDEAPAEADYPLELPLAEAEKVLEDAARDFFAEVLEPEGGTPIHHAALLATPGLGKTERTLRAAAAYAEHFAGEGGKRLHVFVPDNTLAAEVEVRARALFPDSVNVRSHRGRTDEVRGEMYCHPDMRAHAGVVEELGGNVADMVCKTCPFKAGCGWVAQRNDKKAPGVVVMPSAYLTQNTARNCDMAVIDEAFIQSLDTGVTVDPAKLLAAGDIDLPEWERDWQEGTLKRLEAIDSLAKARQKLYDAMGGGKHVPTPAQLRDAGLTEGTAELAKDIEYGRADAIKTKLKEFLADGLTGDALRAALASVRARFKDAGSNARVWGTIKAQLSPDIMTARPDKPLNGWRVTYSASGAQLQVGYRKRLKIADQPVLAIDATGDARLLKLALPNLRPEDVTRVHAQAPHMRVVQVVDRANSKTALVGSERVRDTRERADARARRRDGIVGRVLALTAPYRKAGLISYKALEESEQAADAARRRGEGRLLLGHYGNLRGQNGWQVVDVLAVVGRVVPAGDVLEMLASGLFYDQPEAVPAKTEPGIQRGWGHYRMRAIAGTPFCVSNETLVHAHPVVEMVRRQITEAELVQAVGRARGVRRGAGDAVVVWLLTDVPLDTVLIDDLVTSGELAGMVSLRDRLLGEFGVFPHNARHAFKFFPDEWPSEEAARKEYQRAKGGETGDIPLSGPSIIHYRKGDVPSFPSRVKYRPKGARGPLSTIEYDPARVHDVRAWLEARLGPLSRFEIEQQAETGEIPSTHQPNVEETEHMPRKTKTKTTEPALEPAEKKPLPAATREQIEAVKAKLRAGVSPTEAIRQLRPQTVQQ